MNTLRKITYVAFLTLTIPLLGLAQPPDSLWSRTYGGDRDDRCFSVQQTSDGGYILGGYTHSFDGGYADMWLVKTDMNGDSLWSRTFGGNSSEGCYSVRQTSDGGYILAGYTRSFGQGYYDYWLLKTNSNGDSLWSRTFGSRRGDICNCVQQTSDGGYFLGGMRGFLYDNGDWYMPNAYVIKTDCNGVYQWSFLWGEDAAANAIHETADGGCVFAGRASSFWTLHDFLLAEIDNRGNILWNQTYGGAGQDECYSMLQTSDGGYILAGETSSFGAGHLDIWVVKTDANGDCLWSRAYGTTERERCYSIQQTSDGGYILGGDTWSPTGYHCDAWILKITSDGDSLWSRTFGGNDYDECLSMQQIPDGSFVLAGDTRSFGAGYFDFWLVKTGPELAAEPCEELLPEEYALHQNYPNPFNPSTRISYDLTRTGHVTMKVYDLLGREVATLVDGIQAAGNHSATFDGSGLASGIYLCRLQIGEWSQTRKMVLLK